MPKVVRCLTKVTCSDAPVLSEPSSVLYINIMCLMLRHLAINHIMHMYIQCIRVKRFEPDPLSNIR